MQKIILLFLFTSLAFCQPKTSALEDKIYNAVDIFVANPTKKALENLEVQEKNFNAKSKPELLALVILNCNKAYYQNQFGQTQKAIKSYEKAWQLFQKNKLTNYDIIESCLQPLANLYTIIGDYENAENIIKQYFMVAVSNKNSSQIFAATLNLSNVYQNTGRSYESVELVSKTMKLESFSKTQRGILYNNLGNNLISETMIKVAQHSFEKSIHLLSSDPTQLENLSNAYRNLAKNFGTQKDFTAANQNMQKAEELFNQVKSNTPHKKAQFYYDKASLHFMQNNYVKAQENITQIFTLLIPSYRNGLPDKNSVYAETALLDALDLQATIFLIQNRLNKALESYALAFHIEELFQSVLVYENSKIINQIRNRNRTEKCIEIYSSLHQKENNIHYIEAAFLLSERTKSTVLRQALKDSKTNSRTEKLILKQLQEWNAIIVKEQQKLDSADITKINNAIKKQNELMLLLKSERNKKDTTAGKELKIEDLYAKLAKDKAVLVEYFFGWDNIYIFTLQNRKINLEFISNDHINTPKIVQFLDYFGDATMISDNPSAFNHISNSTYQLLKLPQKTSNGNLIIIPDGVLNFLPFEALITKESKTANFAKMHYLLNDFKIAYNNSAGFYLNAISFQHKKQGVLGVFPIFENSYLELAFSKKELSNLKDNFKGKYLEKENATFENFRSNASNYSILHLSTHASSGDVVEPASIKFYDQEVLYSELYHLDLNPNLVVLSACETGLGKLYKAEGAMSIARGFQFSGAQNIMFSLWKVNDFTTSVLMDKFYGNLKAGKSYSDSNHQAKLDFLNDETLPNAKKSPYYWTPFVYYGTLEDQPSPINYFPWISIIVGLIAVLLLWKFRSRKH